MVRETLESKVIQSRRSKVFRRDLVEASRGSTL